MTCYLVSSHHRSDKTLAVQPRVAHDQPWSNITPHQTKTTTECLGTHHPTTAYTHKDAPPPHQITNIYILAMMDD